MWNEIISKLQEISCDCLFQEAVSRRLEENHGRPQEEDAEPQGREHGADWKVVVVFWKNIISLMMVLFRSNEFERKTKEYHGVADQCECDIRQEIQQIVLKNSFNK